MATMLQVDALLIALIDKLDELQVKNTDKYWLVGTFPNYRSNKFWFYRRPDNSVFYTACIALILKQHKPALPPQAQDKAQIIIKRAADSFAFYQNSAGLATYNFYPTKPSQHFGNGWLMHRFRHFKLPDDADDTALIYQIIHDEPEQYQWLSNKLEAHSIGDRRNIVAEFSDIKAYSTWFGQYMPLEYDLVVLCNVCMCMQAGGYAHEALFSNSLQLLERALNHEKFAENSQTWAPNYGSQVLVLYHVAKLCYKLGKIEAALGHICKKLLQKAQPSNDMERILLYTSKLYVGLPVGEVPVFENFENFENKKYSYFMAGLLNSFPQAWLRPLKNLRFFQIQWQCPAHNIALGIELLALDKTKRATMQ
jgi:hypothetical protein